MVERASRTVGEGEGEGEGWEGEGWRSEGGGEGEDMVGWSASVSELE